MILNTFWNIVAQANLGVEYIWGSRMDKGGTDGSALWANLLFYYDFRCC